MKYERGLSMKFNFKNCLATCIVATLLTTCAPVQPLHAQSLKTSQFKTGCLMNDFHIGFKNTQVKTTTSETTEPTIFDINKKCIERRMQDGLNLLKRNYLVIPVDTKGFNQLEIQNMVFNISQYEVVGVGNLSIMTCTDSQTIQMDSFVLTPYNKNLPLFSSDYMYMGKTRSSLTELYSLVEKEDCNYQAYIKKFEQINESYKDLPDMPSQPYWYDSIRPVHSTKMTTPDNDEDIYNIFMSYLKTFIQMEKSSKFLGIKDYQTKWQLTQNYVDQLIEQGGVSTNMFKAALGAEKTQEFFDNVFFGTASHKLNIKVDIKSFMKSYVLQPLSSFWK